MASVGSGVHCILGHSVMVYELTEKPDHFVVNEKQRGRD